MDKKSKPFPMWPVWLFGLILILILPGSLRGVAFVGTVIGVIIVYKRNVKNFGKGYIKRMKEEKKDALSRS